MNLESIQERLSDIQNLRSISSQNEAAVSQKKQGNSLYWNEEKKEEDAQTGLNIRFFIALCLFGLFLWADKQESKNYQPILEKVETAISYNLTFEDMKDICYTNEVKELLETIQNFMPKEIPKV